ncbi:MAG: sigma-54 dependent transcriptional regulator [Candidatus Sumerlaeia bacterium]|nr:sigma-54 dependent transcriptional regulator [Candidatus Sumerlaeia bacterium]
MDSARPAYRGNVVVLDDEPGMCRALTKLLTLEGLHVTAFQDPKEALQYLMESPADLLISDIRMPGLGGPEVLRQTIERGVPVEVVLMTAFGTIEQAIECVKAGAYDYVTKPLNHAELLATIQRALDTKRLKDRNRALGLAMQRVPGAEHTLLGDSAAMKAVRSLIGKIAPAPSAVLVTGESGTGKELAARALHRLSPRKDSPFVAINCASIPAALIESELFGHERGAFTGATETKLGLVEVADGGTLFLDEIGELPGPMQAKLLRVLQEREIVRVGGISTIHVDIRVVAATNRDLKDEIREGRFREDLYYRLNVITVEMPPLSARREDIPALANAFLAQLGERYGRPGLAFSPEALAALSRRSYPGNIRELRNLVERATILASGEIVGADAVGIAESSAPDSRAPGVPQAVDPRDALDRTAHSLARGQVDFKEARDRFEREYLRGLLRECGGSVAEAARRAGMGRRTLYEKMEKLGIAPDSERPE